MICSSDGFTNILTLQIYEIECCYLHSSNIRINKQTQFHVKSCRFVVLNSWNYLSDELITRLIWLVKTLWRFGIRDLFLRENLKLVFFRENTTAHFFWKKFTIRIFERKVILFCLHLRLAKVPYGVRTPWYECLSIYIMIRHYFKHFTVLVFVKISVRFVIIKTGHNFQKLSLCISFFLSLCPTTIPMTIFPFFSHMNFFINIELWHFYVIFVTLIWCCVCKINYYF
jgi:hypothetical protein